LWLFTETGFVSVVRDVSEKDLLVARARDKESLAGLSEAAGVPLEETPLRDYPYRVHLPRKVFTVWLLKQVAELDYTNYKSRMWQTRGAKFAQPLHEVWSAMHAVTEGKNLR